MPYRVWEEKLRLRLRHWYKVYNESNRDFMKVKTHTFRTEVGNFELHLRVSSANSHKFFGSNRVSSEEKLPKQCMQNWESCSFYFQTLNKVGIEEKFFRVVGHKSPMEKKKYHELTFFQRVWILKGLCDWCMVSDLIVPFVRPLSINQVLAFRSPDWTTP